MRFPFAKKREPAHQRLLDIGGTKEGMFSVTGGLTCTNDSVVGITVPGGKTYYFLTGAARALAGDILRMAEQADRGL